MDYLGRHLLAEFYECSREILDDETRISAIMTTAVEISKATIIKPFFHKFSPQGVSGIIVIAESHLAIHTWPEHGYAAVDLFSCGDFDFTGALKYLRDKLYAEKYSIISIKRGSDLNSSSETPVEHFESQKIYL
jgi:S-adenosylmethionine decarboxylase